VIDALLKVETPNGPTWHRYNGDGYGEHQDGEPFDGTGIGRGWPLLSGERAHYELAAGNRTQAIRLLHAMEAFANKGGMLSEQIWDSEDIPEKELFCGRPSGSAMPLLWAHAEYVKLRRSLQDGKPFDTPPQTIQRYVNTQTPSPYVVWCFNHKVQSIPAGKQLRIETLSPAVIYWSINNRKRVSHRPTREALLGLHYLDLPTEKLPSGSSLTFNFYWPDEDRWESGQYSLQVVTNNSVQAP
jgi:glucoamylase